jgi:hypothetical protein
MIRVFVVSLVAASVCGAPATAGPNFFVGLDDDASSTFITRGAFVTDLNVGALRVPVAWSRGQEQPTAGQVSAIQEVVTAHPDLRVVLVANGLGDDAPTDALAREQYCTFVRNLLRRFATVNDVLIWNEPNLSFFWKPQFHPDGASAAPAAYVQLLARCWDVLHAARPGVNVLAPATSPRGNDNPNAVSNISHSPLAFIREMGKAYRASGRVVRVFDTVAHHPYGSTPAERPWRTHTGTQISEGDWAKLMQAYREGFEGTAQAIPGQCLPGGCVWIWYTEAGYQTRVDEDKLGAYHGTESIALVVPDYAGGEPESPPPSATSPAPDHWTQIIDGVRLAACQPYVQAFFNFLLVDNPDLGSWQSGLLWADGTPKGSYPAFRQVVAEASEGRVDCAVLKGGPPPAPDAIPPAAPTSLTATRGDGRARLAWAAPGDVDVMGYNVYRASPGGTYERVNDSVVASPAFVDTGLGATADAWYAVTAIDTAETEGRPSNEVCAPRAGAGGCGATRPQSAPSVALTAPPDGSVLRGAVELRADAEDDFRVDRVEFVTGGAVVATDSTAPYSATWDTTTARDGRTRIEARAVDGWGNSASSARTITVDNTLPETVITAGPSGTIAGPSVSFAFTGSEDDATFTCSLDAGAWQECRSPQAYASLRPGGHVFAVRAHDAAGNVDPSAAIRSWTVERSPSQPQAPAARPLHGTPGDDVLVGTPRNDVIYGHGGNDVIRGRGGNDLVIGGAGRDWLDGGPGRDRLFGGAGGDTLVGGAGGDRLRGDGGRDRLFGRGGADLLVARDGQRDTLDGGPGRDEGRLDGRLDRALSIERRR